jgi:hypothetical protein
MENEQDLCSLCDEKLDTTGYPLWCKKCRTAKKRALKEAHEAMAQGKGFVAGAEAMKNMLVKGVQAQHPGSMTSFASVAKWISEFPTPRP